MVQELLTSFPKASSSKDADLQHHQMTRSTNVCILVNAMRIKESILEYCGGNPFSTLMDLRSIASSAVIPENCKDDIINFASKGEEAMKRYIRERLVEGSQGGSV